MKRTCLAVALSLCAIQAAFADSCVNQAADKKLSGAAKNSFMKKCESDAKAACNAQAQEKKLSGAAKTSFLKKCNADAIGTTSTTK